MFMKALAMMNKLADPLFGDLKPDDTVDVYFSLTSGSAAERRGPWNSEPTSTFATSPCGHRRAAAGP
jgi:Mn-containing catalase